MHQDLFFCAFRDTKKGLKKIYTVFVMALVFFTYAGVAIPVQAKENPRYASIVMDADTGLILHESNADKKLHPASLTKIMTLLMVFDALEQGKMTLNDRVIISRHAAGMVPSKLDLPAGSSIKVKDAIGALVTKSANDIAVALAEHIGGTESGFARLMTTKARALGMTGTVFTNASGLHDKRQISTARDMAKLAQIVINDYPEYYRYFSTKNFSYNGRSYHNHNRLRETYKGMHGMKTGYIVPSGFNLVASAVRNNRRLIGVVFGGRTSQTRNAHMASLLDSGFARINEIRVASARVPLPPRKPGILVALNTLNAASPAAGDTSAQRLAYADTGAESNSSFENVVGQGDYDLPAAPRDQGGVTMASAPHHVNVVAALPPAQKQPESWSVQIGAFTSRAATDQALHWAMRKLPQQYAQASPMIAPLKTKDGWLFRGRLSGYSRSEAFAACTYIGDCLPVAPKNN